MIRSRINFVVVNCWIDTCLYDIYGYYHNRLYEIYFDDQFVR